MYRQKETDGQISEQICLWSSSSLKRCSYVWFSCRDTLNTSSLPTIYEVKVSKFPKKSLQTMTWIKYHCPTILVAQNILKLSEIA